MFTYRNIVIIMESNPCLSEENGAQTAPESPIITDTTYIVDGGRDLDSSDEYWDNWKRELDAERAKDPEGHKMFVMNAWLRKHPGMSHNDYADYLCEHGTTESMPNEYIEQSNDQNTPCGVRPAINTASSWQRRLTNAPGLPKELWNLSDDELRAELARRAQANLQLPEWQRKLADAPGVNKDLLMSEQEFSETRGKGRQQPTQRIETILHNIIGAANEMRSDITELMEIMSKPDFDVDTLSQPLRVKIKAVLTLFACHGDFLAIRGITNDAVDTALTQQTQAAMRSTASHDNASLTVASPYEMRHNDPEAQAKREEWLQAWKNMPPLNNK